MRKLFAKMDKPLLFLTVLYSVLGLIMVFSASSASAVLRYGVSPYFYFLRQLMFVGAGFVLGFLILIRFPTSKYRFFTPILVLGIIAALIGLFVYGVIVGGAQSWYDFGVFNFQPLEYAKTIMIIYMATYYSKQIKKKEADLISYLIPIAIGIIMCVLIAMQPDLGGAIIIAVIVFFLFISVPLPKKNRQSLLKIVGVGLLLGGAVILFTGKSLISSNQLERFNFKNPCDRYQEKTGYQVCNGFIAFQNGSWLGQGLGNSEQKYLYLPEAHTDFIFAIITEELGLIIGILVVVGYGIILYRIYKIAKKSENLRCSILAYGAFILLLSHILINLLGILALIPLTGVPLPLLSYGGNFNLNVLILLFVVQRVNIENDNNKAKREIAEM